MKTRLVTILVAAVMLFALTSRGLAGHENNDNTQFGQYAGYVDPEGVWDSFFGWSAGYSTYSGSSNVFLGFLTGHDNISGNNDTYIGTEAGQNINDGNDNVFIGHNAGWSDESGSNKLYIDNCASGGNCTSPLIYGEFDNHIVNINGTLVMTAFTSPSDARNKKNIEPLAVSLDKVLQLKGVSYDWKSEGNTSGDFDKRKQIGLIAQEVEEIIPEVVYTDNKGYKSLSYDKLVPLLIEAIKEQHKTIAQKSQIMDRQQVSIKMLSEKLEKLDELEVKLNRLEGMYMKPQK
jgi:hypothetical protein